MEGKKNVLTTFWTLDFRFVPYSQEMHVWTAPALRMTGVCSRTHCSVSPHPQFLVSVRQRRVALGHLRHFRSQVSQRFERVAQDEEFVALCTGSVVQSLTQIRKPGKKKSKEADLMLRTIRERD